MRPALDRWGCDRDAPHDRVRSARGHLPTAVSSRRDVRDGGRDDDGDRRDVPRAGCLTVCLACRDRDDGREPTASRRGVTAGGGRLAVSGRHGDRRCAGDDCACYRHTARTCDAAPGADGADHVATDRRARYGHAYPIANVHGDAGADRRRDRQRPRPGPRW